MESMIVIVVIAFAIPASLSVFCFIQARRIKKDTQMEFDSRPVLNAVDDSISGIELVTICGVGNTMQGNFRKCRIDNKDTFISYYCGMFFPFALWVKGCYRVFTDKWGQKFYFMSREEPDPREIKAIRYWFYGLVLWPVGVLLALLAFVLVSSF